MGAGTETWGCKGARGAENKAPGVAGSLGAGGLALRLPLCPLSLPYLLPTDPVHLQQRALHQHQLALRQR